MLDCPYVPKHAILLAVIIIIIIIIIIITSVCEQIAPTEYVKRTDGLCKVIRQKLTETAELSEDN
jgi:hypothetical protein